MTFLFMNREKNWNEWIWYNILTEYENKEKNIGENKNLSLKEFKQLKFELKCIENYIENYFEIPFMKNNIKYKKINECFD